jgi:predicted nucleic acid-binding protein
MFVLDTDVLSLTSPISRLDDTVIGPWRDWVHLNRDAIHFSVITIMEIRFGMENLIAKGAVQRSKALREWLLAAETVHARRILPVSAIVAHKAGELLHRATRNGGRPSSEDALIAATAVCADFTLVSRNGRHMKLFEIEWIDPLARLPS